MGDFGNDFVQRECEIIAFKLNYFQIETQTTTQKRTTSMLSICEWIFNASAPQNFLYLVQNSLLLVRGHINANIVWQFCLLALLKCHYKFGECMKRFFVIMNGLKVQNVYAQFIGSLAVKYGDGMSHFGVRECEGMKYEIMQFMKSNDIMFWSFDNLQKWLFDLLCSDYNENVQFVEYLFSLMVMGMLYNDSLRVRPELRGLLRFGSYHKLRMNEEVIFEDEVLRECLLNALRDPHHGLSPFKFYIDQFVKYNKRKERESRRKMVETKEEDDNEIMIAEAKELVIENEHMNDFVDDDINKEYD